MFGYKLSDIWKQIVFEVEVIKWYLKVEVVLGYAFHFKKSWMWAWKTSQFNLENFLKKLIKKSFKCITKQCFDFSFLKKRKKKKKKMSKWVPLNWTKFICTPSKALIFLFLDTTGINFHVLRLLLLPIPAEHYLFHRANHLRFPL